MLISQASKEMLNIVQVRIQLYMNQEFPGLQAGIRKGKETRDQIGNFLWIMQKEQEFRKTPPSASLTP